MNEKARREFEKKMIEEADRIMKEVLQDPNVQNVEVPEDAFDNIMNAIREKEAKKAGERLSAEEKELIRLGQVYRRKRRNQRKYLAATATMVLVLAFGITSLGGPEKVYEKITWIMAGREQESVDSEDIEEVAYVDEEEAYAEIEEKYGFSPVKLDYLPEGVEFQEATIYDEIQGIYLVYGKEGNADILYFIRPNFRDGSWSKDIEDELEEEYEVIIKDISIQVKEYLVEDGTARWFVQFEYGEVGYSITINDMKKEEVEKIIENLYFF